MLHIYLANCVIEHGCCLKIHSFNLLQSLKQVSTPRQSQINVWLPPSGCMLKVICVLVEIQVFEFSAVRSFWSLRALSQHKEDSFSSSAGSFIVCFKVQLSISKSFKIFIRLKKFCLPSLKVRDFLCMSAFSESSDHCVRLFNWSLGSSHRSTKS